MFKNSFEYVLIVMILFSIVFFLIEEYQGNDFEVLKQLGFALLIASALIYGKLIEIKKRL